MSTRSSSRIGYHHCLGECGAINTSTHGFFRCFQYLRYQYRWGEHIQTFFSMSYWVNLLPKIQVADPKRERKKTCNSFLSIFGVYTSIFGVENFKKNLFTNSCFIRLHSDIWYPCWPLWQSSANKICEQLGSLFLDLLHWNIFQARQHSWKDFAPPPHFPIEKIWHHWWVVSTEFMLFSSMLSKWIWANWTTLISN